MNTHYLVIGATGAIGFAFTQALLEADRKVTILVRDQRKALSLFGASQTLNIVKGDVYDSALLHRLASDADFIFHGANVPYEHWATAMPVITRRIIDAAEISCATVIFPGNNYNYGCTDESISEITPFDPCASLGSVRVQLERMLQQATDQGRIRTLVVRLAELWGPNVTNKMFAPVFENARRGKAMPWLVTDQVPQQLLFNRDAGQAIAALTLRKNRQAYEVFNMGGTLVPSINSWLKNIAAIAGHSARIFIVPKTMVNLLGLVSPSMKAIKSTIYKYEHTIALNDTKLAQVLPAVPSTPMNRAIEETLSWFAQNGQHSTLARTRRAGLRKQAIYRFAVDNVAIGLFPLVIALLGSQVAFIGSNAVLFGVVAGIYWTPGLHSLVRRCFPRQLGLKQTTVPMPNTKPANNSLNILNLPTRGEAL